MMNNKGFTLTELLAIIGIIAVIMLIAGPSMTGQIKKEEEERKAILEKKIKNASKIYASKYYADKLVKLTAGGSNITFTLEDLEKDGLIDLKGECNTEYTKEIIVKYSGSQILYDYDTYGVKQCYE